MKKNLIVKVDKETGTTVILEGIFPIPSLDLNAAIDSIEDVDAQIAQIDFGAFIPNVTPAPNLGVWPAIAAALRFGMNEEAKDHGRAYLAGVRIAGNSIPPQPNISIRGTSQGGGVSDNWHAASSDDDHSGVYAALRTDSYR